MGLYTWTYEKLWGEDFQKAVDGMTAESSPALAKAMVHFHSVAFTGFGAIAAWSAAENITGGDWIDRAASVPEVGVAGAFGALAIDAFNQARKIGREQPEAEDI
ncbi:MAG TPA: hypothetical protein VFL85_02080 [Candidatus Saccharimonadales bacterium]|nr:hypothetical protein [Candidatus Saccharimonadales bacterium]